MSNLPTFNIYYDMGKITKMTEREVVVESEIQNICPCCGKVFDISHKTWSIPRAVYDARTKRLHKWFDELNS